MMRASLDKRPQDVARMFDDVAARYDLTNDVLTGGLDRYWRRVVTAAIEPAPGVRVLDIAAGTGTSSVPLQDAGAEVVAADFSLGMLRKGRERQGGLPFAAADALRLPFADASFDVVTMSFGLRNVVDTAGAIREFARVTRPGGRLVVCEFSTPTNGPFRAAYHQFLTGVLPPVARRVGSNAESYVYLAESIEAWPDQAGLARIISASGWQGTQWRDLSGGIVAVHRATRP
jgi:demethylmenaquinone methyltransferase / 2-methoxy-6-polyprenyl-1,4-benzoquinol methylase